MKSLSFNNFSVSVDFEKGLITSLILGGCERVFYPSPVFTLRLRDRSGKESYLSVESAKSCFLTEDGAIYSNFEGFCDLAVKISLKNENGEAAWRVETEQKDDSFLVEWIDLAPITLAPLRDNNENGDGGEIHFPYNEGALISDVECREEIVFRHVEPEYPSHGGYAIFPNMVCSQMLSYHWAD